MTDRYALSIVSAFVLIVAGAFSDHSQAADAAETLLKKADDVRNPGETYKMKINVKTDSTEQEFEVFLKGRDKTLVVIKSPIKDRGRNMLMLERDFQAFIPNLKKSVRLSLAQKMSGEVANGDIARTRWFGDYKPTIEKTEGANTVLFLEGLKSGLTYQKLRLWVETKTARPLSAEFLGLDGKTLLKRARFENYKSIEGAMRPTLLKIEDVAGKSSTITILSQEKTELSDSLFTVQSLEKVR
jgi:outer membrane lipoprotein-sorting protein